jgi:hypothetical protein
VIEHSSIIEGLFSSSSSFGKCPSYAPCSHSLSQISPNPSPLPWRDLKPVRPSSAAIEIFP